MEYYYRCQKCGRRTPSFDYEDHLKDYAIDWNITDNECICPKCASGENDKYLKKTRIWEMICMSIITIGIIMLLLYKV